MRNSQDPPECSTTHTLRAFFVALAPVTVVLAPSYSLTTSLTTDWIPALYVQLGLAALFVVVAIQHRPGLYWTRAVATVGFLAWVGHHIFDLATAPDRGFYFLLAAALFINQVWLPESLRRERARTQVVPPPFPWAPLLIACVVGLDHWLLGHAVTVHDAVALTVLYGIGVGIAAQSRPQLLAKVVLGVAGVLVGAPLLALVVDPAIAQQITAAGILSPAVLLVFRGWFRHGADTRVLGDARTRILDVILARPSRVVVASFVLVCAVGTLLLRLPFSGNNPEGISWLDAVFTSVSATCVTGLAVLDTPVAFGKFGQAVLLGLIQVGGLGIMAFSSAAVAIAGRRLSLAHEQTAAELMGAEARADLVTVVWRVLIVTAVTEGVATVLLTLGFMLRGDAFATALWRGLFTAVSAFCNAGFALQSDSLVGYADSPFILSVIGLTILVGGLGPLVIVALLRWRDIRVRTLHVRLVVASTVVLLVAPGVLFLVVEWNGFLGPLAWTDKIMNAIFQSITLRTAGFNSVDLTSLHAATWTVMLMMMFVGGSPGSTAGGVKTTTIAVLLLSVVSTIRGRATVGAFGRAVPTALLLRAATVLTLAMATGFLALTAILLTQPISLEPAMFEVVSALGTVGLSLGATAQLDDVGKAIIIGCMFVGRIGPLSLFLFFSGAQSAPTPSSHLVEEAVPIG